MAGTNEIKLFAGPSTNTLTPAAWAALTSLLANGFSPGLASSEQANTLFRQLSTVAAAVGDYIANQGFNALDNGVVANMSASLASATSGRLIKITVYATPGTSTFTADPRTTSVIAEVCGGGGGGGGTAAAGASLYSISQSGGGGSYGKGRYTVGFSGVTVTVGAGGTAGAAGGALGTTAGNGGTSSFGALLSCPGGQGANIQATQQTPSTNWSMSPMPGGGAPSGANILAVAGGQAGVSWQSGAGLGMRGRGGASFFGPGAGENQNGNLGPTTPLNFGEGGTGAFSYNGFGAYAGTNGMGGVVIVYEYA